MKKIILICFVLTYNLVCMAQVDNGELFNVMVNPRPSHFKLNVYHKKLKSLEIGTYTKRVDSTFAIKSFDIVVTRNQNVIDSLHFEGNLINEQYLEVASDLITGDHINFRNILILNKVNKKLIYYSKPIYVRVKTE